MLTIDKFREFVGSSIFTVVFVKADKTLRVMNARLGVAKHVLGTQPEVTAKRKETLTARNKIGVYEMPKMQYRTINLNTVKSITARGVTLNFDEGA